MPQLHLVPYGLPAIDALRHAIALTKGADALQPVTVAVPSNYAGLSLRRILGSADRGLVNVRFMVLSRVAELLGSPALAAQGKRPLTGPVRAEAVRTVVSATPGIFRAVLDHPATERSLEITFGELRRVPEGALDLLASQSERSGQVVHLFREFRRQTADYYDEEDLALAAANAVLAGSLALRDIGHVIVYLPRRLSPAERTLLEALAEAGRLEVLIGLTGDPDADRLPRQLAAQLEDALGPAEETISTAEPAETHIVLATDAEEEARSVLRLIMERLAAGTPLHRIAVLYRASQPYALLAQEQFRAAGVPHNGPGVRTLAQTVAGRTLLGLFRLRETDFRREIVMDWLSGAPILEEPGRSPAPAQRWDLLSRSAGILRGAAQWQERLASHRRSLERERADLEAMEQASEGRIRHLEADLEHVERLARFVQELVALLEPGGGQTWPEYAGWARGLLERYLGGEAHRREWPEDEIEAHRAVMAALDSLSALEELRPQVDEGTFLRALQRELEASAGRVGRFGEGVFIGRISDAMGTDFDVVYVLGMTEGLMPPRGKDDPLLPDRERVTAGEDIPLRTSRLEEERRDYLAALASARERVLVFARADLRGQRGRLPARWLLQEASRLEGRTLYSGDMDPPPSRPWLTVVPSFHSALQDGRQPASEQEYDLRSLLRWQNTGAPVADHYRVNDVPALRFGLSADLARGSPGLTRWDGLAEAAGLLAPSQERPTSPTALQDWAVCPFRYFLGHVLRVAETEKPEETLTITARERGRLLHRALEMFIGEAAARTSPDAPWTREERSRLQEIGRLLCDEAEEAGLTGKPLLWRLEHDRILRDLAGFLDADEDLRRESGVVPLAAEVSFGMAVPTSGSPVVVALADGTTIVLRGKIDRIDGAPDGSRLLVLDYKSGSAGPYTVLRKDPVKRGQLLQLPIYALAARESHGSVPVEAYYWFATEEQSYRLIGYPVEDAVLKALYGALAVIVDGISSGLFPCRPGNPRNGSHENCTYCPYDRVCPRDRGRAWERKRGAPELSRYLAMVEPDE